MTTTRKLYLLTAAIFAVGAVLAIIKAETVAIIVFVVLMLMMLWIQSRVDKFVEDRRPSDAPEVGRRPSEQRPSERRANRPDRRG